MRSEALISMGSNIERERHIARAFDEMRAHPRIEITGSSRVYITKPVGGDPEAPEFFNAALRVITDLSPLELRRELRRMEARLGRVRTDDPNASRTIDLDVSMYGNLREAFDGWTLPAPDILDYPHVAVPLADVAGEWIHPETGDTLEEVVKRMDHDETSIRPARPSELRTASFGDGRYAVDFEADEGEVYAPQFEALVGSMLVELGEDPHREGLERTPLRVAKAMSFLTSGYSMKLDEVVNNAIFDSEDASEMVVVKDIEFYSLCEHHMLPFFGRANVAYLPRGKIIGLSKIARIVDLYARRFQVQERLTNQVADAMLEVLDPHGAAVVMEGSHLCMMMRGVQKQGSSMKTSAMRGTFRNDARTRSEFLDLIR